MNERKSGTRLTRDELEDAIFEETLRKSRPRVSANKSLERDLSIALILSASSSDRKSDLEFERLGRLHVRNRIGGGGLGVVYGAYDPELRRNVAIKLLRGNIGREKREMIAAEARTLAQLSHPNVVTIYDIVDDGDEVYFVMELVQGVTLHEWLEVHPEASWREVVAIFVQAGRGLCAAHEKGIVHGDFKPRNVVIGDDQRVRVVDFGFAHLTHEDSEPLRGGTPGVMAPEVATGDTATTMSDQYSFCLSLRNALEDKSPPEVVLRLLRRGLRDEPSARHESLVEVVDKLDAEHSARRDRSDHLLLERVERLWLTGVLYRSLAGYEPEALLLRARPDLIDSPWDSWSNRPRVSDAHARGKAYHSTDIVALMEQSYNALLIVGSPGAGKTTLLLQLCKELWRAASQSEDAPRPIVLNISSYQVAQDGTSLAEHLACWIVDEVVAKYGLPRPAVRKWLEDASLTLLLDGLDEVAPHARKTMVEALNAFRELYPVALVVSCRDSEYQSIGQKLCFGGALQIEPLSDKAVFEIVNKRGAGGAAESETIQSVLRNPLLLTLYAQGKKRVDLTHAPEWKRVYDQVVGRALEKLEPHEDAGLMHAQLKYLGRVMQRLNRSELWIEQLDFSWLDTRWKRGFGYLTGIMSVFICGVGLNVAQIPITQSPTATAWTFGFGVSIGSFAYTRGKIKPVERLRWSWRRFVRLLPVTTVCASLVGLAEGLRINFASNMVGAAITGAILALAFALEPGEQPSKVHPNAGVRRSFYYATGLAILIGLPVGLLFGLVINPYVTRPLTTVIEHNSDPRLVVGVGVGLFVATALFLIYGGFTVIMHWVLRLWMSWTTPLPLRLVRTLDRFVELDLMRRVGGGYVFLHRTLLDYFAEDATAPSSDEKRARGQIRTHV